MALTPPAVYHGAGCEFSVAQTLLACAPVEGNSFIRARCGQNNACGSVAAHGRECACSRCFFVHTLLISCPGVCQFCPTTSRGSSDVQNLQPAHSQNTQTASFSVPERRPEHTFLAQ